VEFQDHNPNLAPEGPYVFRGCTFTTAGTKLAVRGDSQPDTVEVHDCALAPMDVQVPHDANAGTVVRIYEGGQLTSTVEP
jgi:hypothetical protein